MKYTQKLINISNIMHYLRGFMHKNGTKWRQTYHFDLIKLLAKINI